MTVEVTRLNKMATPNLASFEVGEILEVKTEPTNTRNQFSQMTALIR